MAYTADPGRRASLPGQLAIIMTIALDKIGCALSIPSTVMGLTFGAIGTSFPNLYASILTAQAGQAGMSLCQAFGSNTLCALDVTCLP